jgi:chemotaxis protein CheX
MQVKYINPFTQASVKLFKEFLQVDITPGKPYVKEDPYDLEEVSGIIGLAGETSGAVVLSFSRQTAIEAVSKMEETPYQALSKGVIDGVGELVNIIAGNAKQGLLDFRIEISLPGVITGKSYQIHWPENVPVIGIPFDSSIGSFHLYVSFKEHG